jgi:hypothetical protein
VEQAEGAAARLAASERGYSEMAARVDELSAARARLEQDRVRAGEALAAALAQQHRIGEELQSEREASAGVARREEALRKQVEAAEWALAHNAAQTEAIAEVSRQHARAAQAAALEAALPQPPPPLSPEALSPYAAAAQQAVEAQMARANALAAVGAAATLAAARVPTPPHTPLSAASAASAALTATGGLSPSRGAAALAARHLATLDPASPIRASPLGAYLDAVRSPYPTAERPSGQPPPVAVPSDAAKGVGAPPSTVEATRTGRAALVE